MAYYPLSILPIQLDDDDGTLLSGGTIEAFVAGTSTPTNMFTNKNGTVAGTSITLNARGEPEVSGNTVDIWLDTSVEYKFVLKDASGVAIYTIDNIQSQQASGINYNQGSTGADDRTQADKNKDFITTFDFLTTSQKSDVRGFTGSVDVTAAIQEAIDALSNGGTLWWVPGKYKVRDKLNITTDNIKMMGYGVTIAGGADQSSTDGVFTVDANGFEAYGFFFDMDARVPAIRVEPASASLSNFVFSEMRFEDAFYAIRIDGTATYSVNNVEISHCKSVGPNGQNHGHFFADYTNYISVSDCHIQYGQDSSAYGFANCTYITVNGCSERDVSTAGTVEAALEIEDSPSAFASILGNTFEHDIWLDDSTDVTIGPNMCRRLRFTVTDTDQTSIQVTGGVIGRLQVESIGTPGAVRTSANIVGVTFDPAHYSEAYGIFATGTYVGDLKIKNCDFVSDGSTANVSATRDASATYTFVENDFNGGTVTISGTGGTLNARGNTDLISKNSGTDTIASGNTSVVVSHGCNLGVAPTAGQVRITPAENATNDVGTVYVTNLQTTQMTVACESDPGASGLDFGWSVDLEA